MSIRREYSLVADEENGYWMLLQDDVGIAKSKSRNSLKRIRDALRAVEDAGLVGLLVENTKDTVPSRIDGFPRGVVLAINGHDLIVRRTDDKLDEWLITHCRLVEPEKPTTPTPWNDPAIGIYTAVKLLQRVVDFDTLERAGAGFRPIADDIRKFLEAREAAQPT
jgi:hypothetical protein